MNKRHESVTQTYSRSIKNVGLYVSFILSLVSASAYSQFGVPCPATVNIFTGQMQWTSEAQCNLDTALNKPIPEGSYQETCNPVYWSAPGVLSGQCLSPVAGWVNSTLENALSCPNIQNINGYLRCD